MEEHDIAVVKKVSSDYIWIEMEKNGSCSNCSMNGICQQDGKSIIHKIRTDRSFEVDDTVQVEVSPKLRIFSSFIIFLFPIITMVIFYLIAKYLISLSEDFSIISSLFGVLLSGFIVYLIDKKYSDKISIKILSKLKR